MTRMTDNPEAPVDPPEFDRSLVPDSPFAELFYDGRDGRGLTDAEYDETVARLEHMAATLPPADADAARRLLIGIRGRA